MRPEEIQQGRVFWITLDCPEHWESNLVESGDRIPIDFWAEDSVVKELGIDQERFDVNGGAIAIGHPLGATGARLTLTLLYELRRRSKRYGVASMCIGGGQGIAVIVEAL